jgi:Rieske Fe-S protein
MKDQKNGEGRIVNINGQRVGVYKDESGNIYAVTEKCTYEGCDIYWVADRRIWKCPCCGSEYSIEGKVLKGPATENLMKIKI